MWDVFISHAWEDKETVARPLAEALSREGLKVWYDEFALTLGDSLRRSIDRGLAKSKYGVVILSPHFFAKEWPRRELDGLTAREASSGKTILPVWHNVTREDVERFSPVLADKLGVSTARGLDTVIQEILRVLRLGAVPVTARGRPFVHPPPPVAAPVPGVVRESLFTLLNRAEANRLAGRYDDAIRDAMEALSIEPQNAFALRVRAEAYRCLGRYDDAIRDTTEALSIEPQNAFALRERAEAYQCLGRYDDAIRDAEESLRIEPGNTFALDTIKRSRFAEG